MPRIKRARVSFVSFVPRGANQLPGLYKSDEGFEAIPMLKDDLFEEKGQLTAVVYAPEHRDAQGHIASANVIEKMAHSFMEEGAKLDLKHNRRELKKDQAYVAESFIIQEGDPRFSGIKDHLGKQIDPTGGWGMILQINDNELKKAYREGNWNGVSLFSYAGDYQLEEEGDPVSKAVEEFERRINSKMDEKKLADLLKENNEVLVSALAEALKKEPEKEQDSGGPEDGTPIFKGDPSKIEDVKAFEKELKLHKLREQYDFNDPQSLAKYVEELEKLKEEDSPEDRNKNSGDESNDNIEKSSPEIERLEAQIEALQKQISKEKKKTNVTVGESDLEKKHNKAWDIGLDIAKISNEKRGLN